MDPILADTLAPILALVAIGTFGLIGLKMYLTHRARALHGPASPDTERLARELIDVRALIEAVRDDVGELYERVEFAERVLTKGREAPGE